MQDGNVEGQEDSYRLVSKISVKLRGTWEWRGRVSMQRVVLS